MLKRNTQRRRLAENARWDASDSWGDLHRTGASRLGVDQEIHPQASTQIIGNSVQTPGIRTTAHPITHPRSLSCDEVWRGVCGSPEPSHGPPSRRVAASPLRTVRLLIR